MHIVHLGRRLLFMALASPVLLLAVPSSASAACPSATARLDRLFYGPPTGDKYVTVIAHRGWWGAENPRNNYNLEENSPDAINDAAIACMDAVELDVKMTSDGVPVVMHDFNLGRTTNIWTKFPGQAKYNPATNTGANDLVSAHTSTFYQTLSLLSNDRSSITTAPPPTVDGAIVVQQYSKNGIPIIWDVKTTAAAHAINNIVGKYGARVADTMAMKVNASLYTTQNAYNADVPNIRGIPVFVTNNLSQINVTAVRNAWASGANNGAIEANVKSPGGFLQNELLNWALERVSPVGVFQAIPDYPGGGGRFYNNDGSCCYTLADKYITYNGQKETSDQRGSFQYLLSQGFSFVTTDTPYTTGRLYRANGRH